MSKSPSKATVAKQSKAGVSSANYSSLTEKNVQLDHIATLEEVAREERQVA